MDSIFLVQAQRPNSFHLLPPEEQERLRAQDPPSWEIELHKTENPDVLVDRQTGMQVSRLALLSSELRRTVVEVVMWHRRNSRIHPERYLREVTDGSLCFFR